MTKNAIRLYVFLCVYGALLMVVSCVCLPIIVIVFSQKKYRFGIWHRLGFRFFHPHTEGEAYILVHGVSVGEINAAMPLIEKLKACQQKPILITCTTLTGFHTAKKYFPDMKIEFFPMDFFFSVRRFFNHYAIHRIFILETEIWPQFFGSAALRHIPVTMVNGRISDKSYPRFCVAKPWLNLLWSCVDHIFCASKIDLERFESLGVAGEKLHLIPSMKFESAYMLQNRPCTFKKMSHFKLFVIGSSHFNEHLELLGCFLKLNKRFPEFKCALVPRKTETLKPVYDMLTAMNIPFKRWSDMCHEYTRPQSELKVFEEVSILIVDVMGVLVPFYQIADIAFVGKTLHEISAGGQNPLEPAIFENIIFMGRHYENFREIVDQMQASSGLIVVKDVCELEDSLVKILTNYEKYVIIGQRAKRFVEAQTGACDLILRSLKIG